MDSRILSSLTATESAYKDGRAEAVPSLRHRVEYWAAKGLLQLLGTLPHRLARLLCTALAGLSYWFWPGLRRVGLWNLRLAYPEWSPRERRRVLFASFQNLGRMLADFAHFPHWNRTNIEQLIVYDG